MAVMIPEKGAADEGMQEAEAGTGAADESMQEAKLLPALQMQVQQRGPP